jgi:hypothetical protein
MKMEEFITSAGTTKVNIPRYFMRVRNFTENKNAYYKNLKKRPPKLIKNALNLTKG